MESFIANCKKCLIYALLFILTNDKKLRARVKNKSFFISIKIKINKTHHYRTNYDLCWIFLPRSFFIFILCAINPCVHQFLLSTFGALCGCIVRCGSRVEYGNSRCSCSGAAQHVNQSRRRRYILRPLLPAARSVYSCNECLNGKVATIQNGRAVDVCVRVFFRNICPLTRCSCLLRQRHPKISLPIQMGDRKKEWKMLFLKTTLLGGFLFDRSF